METQGSLNKKEIQKGRGLQRMVLLLQRSRIWQLKGLLGQSIWINNYMSFKKTQSKQKALAHSIQRLSGSLHFHIQGQCMLKKRHQSTSHQKEVEQESHETLSTNPSQQGRGEIILNQKASLSWKLQMHPGLLLKAITLAIQTLNP